MAPADTPPLATQPRQAHEPVGCMYLHGLLSSTWEVLALYCNNWVCMGMHLDCQGFAAGLESRGPELADRQECAEIVV